MSVTECHLTLPEKKLGSIARVCAANSKFYFELNRGNFAVHSSAMKKK
jgi:hypothetical protein